MRPRKPLWREPLAYPACAVLGAAIWTGSGEVLDPAVPWQEHAITGAAFGVVMVLVVGCQDWLRQRRVER